MVPLVGVEATVIPESGARPTSAPASGMKRPAEPMGSVELDAVYSSRGRGLQ